MLCKRCYEPLEGAMLSNRAAQPDDPHGMSSANSNRAAAQKLVVIGSTLSIRAAGFRAAR